MKIEKINDSEILWSLDKEDFKTNGMDVYDVVVGTPKVRMLFQEALEMAEKDLMFQSKGYLLDCQLRELTAQGATFSIKKKEQKGQKSGEQESNNMASKNLLDDVYHLMYEFTCLDDIIRISGMSAGLDDFQNSLYKYGETYLLFAEPLKNRKDQVIICTMNLSEFASIQAVTKGQMTFIKEHSKCILGQEALQQLGRV